MGTERGGCSRLMKTPRHNGGAVHSRSMRAKKKDNHCSGPTTEEEQTHCEMIKEAVKGMLINESRTAAEAEFIKTHIVDYEKIFDVCMNGDDLEFKKGLVRLQKMQNEYVMQREND